MEGAWLGKAKLRRDLAHGPVGGPQQILGPQPAQGTLSAAQRYYLAYARVWRRNYRDEELQLLSRIDVHAPAKWRVNGPLANLAPFAEAFKCKVGKNSMMRADKDRVTVF